MTSFIGFVIIAFLYIGRAASGVVVAVFALWRRFLSESSARVENFLASSLYHTICIFIIQSHFSLIWHASQRSNFQMCCFISFTFSQVEVAKDFQQLPNDCIIQSQFHNTINIRHEKCRLVKFRSSNFVVHFLEKSFACNLTGYWKQDGSWYEEYHTNIKNSMWHDIHRLVAHTGVAKKCGTNY